MVAQQVLMLQLSLGGTPLNTDQWDGYKASRDRFFDAIEQDGPRNTVVLGGDIHTAWAADLTRDLSIRRSTIRQRAWALAVEFITPAVTQRSASSGSTKGSLISWTGMRSPRISSTSRSHAQDISSSTSTRHGPKGAYFHFETLEEPDAKAASARRSRCSDGLPHLLFDDGPAPSEATSRL